MSWRTADLVTAWEMAGGLTPPVRTAVLVYALGLAGSPAGALDLDVGSTASLLAAGYAETYGDRVDLVVECGACGTTLEADVELPRPDPGPTSARRGRWEVRRPTLGELAAVYGDPAAATRLRRWCVRPASGDDAPAGTAGSAGVAGVAGVADTAEAEGAAEPALDGAVGAALDEALDELAAAALPSGPVTCPQCGTRSEVVLDTAALLWDRLRRDTPRLLSDVAILASAFGWSEAEILALTDARRQAYLQLAGDRS